LLSGTQSPGTQGSQPTDTQLDSPNVRHDRDQEIVVETRVTEAFRPATPLAHPKK
jgi:hypothetical protein